MARKHNTQHSRSPSNYKLKKQRWGYSPDTNPMMHHWDTDSIERAKHREYKAGYGSALEAYRARGRTY